MTNQTKRIARRWTAEETNVLRTMYSAGVAHKDIAKMLNRTVSAVQQRAHYEGLTTTAQGSRKHVSDTLTNETVLYDVSSETTTSTHKLPPN